MMEEKLSFLNIYNEGTCSECFLKGVCGLVDSGDKMKCLAYRWKDVERNLDITTPLNIRVIVLI